MKLLVVLLIGSAYSATDRTQDRPCTMSALRQAMASFKKAQDDAMLHVTEAKSRVSAILGSFYDAVFEQQLHYVELILRQEAEVLEYGEQNDSWCWEHNIPLLQGIMGWFGTDFSECVKQLERRVGEAIGNVTEMFLEDDEQISQYSLLKVFQRKNIITNPQSIVDVIAAIVMNATAISGVEISQEVAELETELQESIPGFSEFLESRLKKRTLLIEVMKDQTVRCMEEQEE